MILQVVHTHTNESCPAQSAEQTKRLSEWWQAMKKAPGVKVLAGHVSPIDHTFFITVEADDYASLAKALGPLNTWGSGRTSPVLTLDQALPMAEIGIFRATR